jgi:hypothetical protein
MNRVSGETSYQFMPDWFLTAEDESVRLFTLTPYVVDAFERAMAHPSPWSGAYVAQGVWTFSMAFPPKTPREVVRERVLGALGYVEAVLDALRGEHGEAADVLAKWAGRTDSPDLTYDAVRMLTQEHPNSPHLARLRASFDTVDPSVRHALVIWDDDLGLDRDARIAHLRGLNKQMPRKASIGYARRFPWTMVADHAVTTQRRLMAAERVFDDPDAPADPAARDAHLLACFTAREFNEHARFYAALREAGWAPTLPTRLHLVDRGHRDTVKLMIEELRAQEALSDDDVVVVEAMGDEGLRVSDLLERAQQVDRRGGQLSLADDRAASGGLTQTAPSGGLEVTEE